MNNIKTSILILVNINNNHWTTAFYNDKNGLPIDNYIINPISLINNKNELEKKISKVNNNYSKDTNLIKIKKEYNDFLNEINNLNNKTIDEVCQFYKSEQNKIDFSSIYYYIKNKDINNGLFGSYPKNFHLITKNKGNREDKKLFKKKCKTFAIDCNNQLIKLKEKKDENGNVKICDLICVPDKYKKVILDYFHIINIHCSYMRLSEIIYSNNYYWNGLRG